MNKDAEAAAVAALFSLDIHHNESHDDGKCIMHVIPLWISLLEERESRHRLVKRTHTLSSPT